MVFVSNKDYAKRLEVGKSSGVFKGGGWDKQEEELSQDDKKLISEYNDKVKNKGTFKKSREIFNSILEDENNKDYERANRIKSHIIQDEKDVKFTENKLATAVKGTSRFAEESNKAFLGGTVEGLARGANFIGSGFNSDKAEKRTSNFMDSTGLKDKDGLNSLENKVKQNGKWRDITDDERAMVIAENENDGASKAGKVFGDSQRIASDIATTLVPAVAAEKAFRGIGAISKLSQGSNLSRAGANVAGSVVGGAAATGVGAIKDPTSLTAGNVTGNVALDVGIGLAGSGLSTLSRTLRTAKNTKQLATALESTDNLGLPKQVSDKLNSLKKAELSGKNYQKEVDSILTEAKNIKKFDVLSDGATLQNSTIVNRIDDIDRRVAEVDTPEYQANNGLLNKEAADAKYEEIMQDVEKIPGMNEANTVVSQADEQIKYYNDLRVKNPLARKVDLRRDEITKIESQRKDALNNINEMAQDTESGFNPESFDQLIKQVNDKFDEAIAGRQKSLDELLAKDPEGAAEIEMLDNAEKQVATQKMEAQKAVEEVASKQEAIAREQADKIAQTPNEEKIIEHKQFLADKKAKLEKRFEEATVRANNPNTSLKDVNEELMYMQDGTHPLIAEGASKEQQYKRYVELNNERASMEAVEIKTSNPDIPKTVEQETVLLDDALEQVSTNEVGVGAKLGRVWSQPANWLRSAGFGKLADQRTDGVLAYNKQAYAIKQQMKDWAKMAKAGRGENTSKQLFAAANGEEGAMEKLTPGGRAVIEAWQKQAYEIGKQMGISEEVLSKGDYIPHLFTDVKRNPRLLDMQKKLVKARKELAAGNLDEASLAKKNKHIEKLTESIRNITDNPSIVTSEDFIKETGEYSNRFLKERYGAEGYEQDFWKATDAYMNAGNTKVNLEPVMEQFAKAKQLTPDKGAAKFFQAEIDKMRGTKADVDRALDDWFNSLTSKVPGGSKYANNAGTKTLRGFRSAMSLSHIGFSLNSAVNTLAQVSIMPGSLNIDGSMYGLMKAAQLTGKLGKNMVTRAETAEFKKMARMGAFEGSSHILPEQTLNKYANKFNKAAFIGITGSDRFLRMSTYYGAELKAKRMGLTGMDEERFIYEKINEVNQNFSKLEAPHAFKSQVTKTMGSLVTFVPGMVVRSAEIGAASLKGAGDIIAHGAKGQPITRAEFMKDVDDISKGLFTAMAVYGVGQGIGAITGQDEVIPNPLDANSYSSPAIQFIFGSEYKTGVMGAFTSQSGDKYDENGGNVTRQERTGEFFNELLPSFLIPGYSQGKRTIEGLEINEKGYSETDNGGMRYRTDKEHDTQRALFGQYATPEGREYIEGMGKPGGGALTESQSTKVKEAPRGLQQQYYEFFKATDKLTGRADVNAEVSKLYSEHKPEAAKRKAKIYNAKVDSKLEELFTKYPDLDKELKDQLRSNVYITLTKASEKARTRND